MPYKLLISLGPPVITCTSSRRLSVSSPAPWNIYTSFGVLCDKNHTLGFAVNRNRFKILESFYIRSLLFFQGFSRRVKLETRAEKTGSPRRLLHAQTLHFLRQNKQVLVLGQFGPLCGNIDGFIIYYIYSFLAFIEYMKCD